MNQRAINAWRKKLIDRCALSGLDRLALVEIAGTRHLIPVDAALDATLAEGASLIGVYTPDCPVAWWQADLEGL